MRTVLVIDDNPAVAQALELLFGLHDIRTVAAPTPEAGLAVLSQQRIDLVIADMNFSADTTSGDEGAELFRALRERRADLPVILLTAWTHLESAVHLVKAGNDYLLLGAAEQGLAPIHRYTEQQAYEAGLLFDEEPEARPRRRLLLPASSSSPEAGASSRPSEVLDASGPSSPNSPAIASIPATLESGERRTDPMRMPSVSSSLIERLRELTVRR